jgi:hypothetical protein
MTNLRNAYTAVIARGDLWSGKVHTEPYEVAWASEAIFFIHLMPESKNHIGAAFAHVQISPDGLHWVKEGTSFALPNIPDTVSFTRVSNFGGWLRLEVDIPSGSEYKVVATLAIKS